MHAFWKSVKIGTPSACSTVIGEACRGLLFDVEDVQLILNFGGPKIQSNLQPRIPNSTPIHTCDTMPRNNKGESDKHVDRNP